MARENFHAQYGIDDGYAGQSRPQYIDFNSEDVEGMSRDEARDYFWAEIDEDMMSKINTYSRDEEEFLEWVEQINEDQDE